VKRVLIGLLTCLPFPFSIALPGGGAYGDTPGCGSSHGSTDVHGNGLAFVINGTHAQPAAACPDQAHTADGPYVQVLQEACALGSAVTCNDPGPDCNGNGGRWHMAQLVFPDGHTEPAPQVCVGGDAAPPTPAQVTSARVLKAFQSVPLPTPTLGMSPPDGITLVNLPTIFYTRAEPFGRDLELLARRVHLEIAPVSYAWSVGPGAEFTTDWAGAPYQDGLTPQDDPDAYVTWTYPHAAASQAATVRVIWGATWTLDGKPMGRVPGTVEMASPEAQVTVREARGVLTSASSG